MVLNSLMIDWLAFLTYFFIMLSSCIYCHKRDLLDVSFASVLAAPEGSTTAQHCVSLQLRLVIQMLGRDFAYIIFGR